MDRPPSDSAAALQNLRAALKDLETAAVGFQLRRRLDARRVAPIDLTNLPEKISPLAVPTPRWRRLLRWLLQLLRRIWRRIREIRVIRG